MTTKTKILSSADDKEVMAQKIKYDKTVALQEWHRLHSADPPPDDLLRNWFLKSYSACLRD